MMDLRDIISSFAGAKLTVKRSAAGSYGTTGLWVKGSTSDVEVTAVVYPAGGKAIQLLPEGMRTTRAVEVLSRDLLQTANEPTRVAADRFTHDGDTFEVQALSAWGEQGSYWHAVATKVVAS